MRRNVLEYLEKTVPRVPDKIAFSDGVDNLTFKELSDISRSIGSFLADKGYNKEPIAVFMDKHPNTVAAFFGVIYSGCYYVPIDAEMPVYRIEKIFETLNPRAVICDTNTRANIDKLGYSGNIYNYNEIIKYEIIEYRLREIRDNQIDTDPIYIVFTSGSTGNPKGVVACHRSVLDYIEQLSETLGFSENTVFGNQTPLYFDACLKELYPTIKFGATTFLIPKELFMFPMKLVDYLNDNKINTICWVVSALTMISGFKVLEKKQPKYLTTIAFGSEVFPIRQFKLWRDAVPNAKFTNLYGPTEATGMSCFYHVNRDFEDGEVIPIGRPFKNTEIILLNKDNKRAELGELGEICIRGTCLTLGYYKMPDKTAENFVQNPLNNCYNELIYRTGDIGKYNEYGELIFVDRKDYQIKHMGHRIELNEIEYVANRNENVASCCAVFDKLHDKIVIYYVGDIDEPELFSYLRGMLPRYMCPNKVEKLEKMMFTANGKIDRKSLTAKAVG